MAYTVTFVSDNVFFISDLWTQSHNVLQNVPKYKKKYKKRMFKLKPEMRILF